MSGSSEPTEGSLCRGQFGEIERLGVTTPPAQRVTLKCSLAPLARSRRRRYGFRRGPSVLLTVVAEDNPAELDSWTSSSTVKLHARQMNATARPASSAALGSNSYEANLVWRSGFFRYVLNSARKWSSADRVVERLSVNDARSSAEDHSMLENSLDCLNGC